MYQGCTQNVSGMGGIALRCKALLFCFCFSGRGGGDALSTFVYLVLLIRIKS